MTTLPAKGTFPELHDYGLTVIAGPGYWATRARLKREVWRLSPPSRTEDMARRYLAGEMLAAIGKAYNISGERVRAILRKAGVKSLGRRATGGRALTSKEKEALRLYSEGVSAPEICARVSISPPRLEYLRKREGVPAKGQGFYLRRPDDAELTSTVARLYLSGMGSTEIARTVPQIKFPETVYRYLKKAGVTPRSKRPKPIPCPSRTDGTGGKPPPVSGAGNS